MTPSQAQAQRNAATRKSLARRNQMALQMPPPPLAIRPPSGVTVKEIEALDRTLTHPEFGLEPRKIVSIYRNAELGWSCQQADLFQGVVERDNHLQACILNRINAVAGKQWQVLPGGDDSQSQLSAQLLDDTLKATNFGDMIAHWLNARYMGWSGAEIFWDRRNGNVLPLWFIDVPARRFSFTSNDHPELMNQTNGVNTPLEPGKWIFVRNRGVFSGITPRAGLLRGATWMSLWKSWSWRDWLIYSEKFGIPLVIGRYKAGAIESEKAVLNEAVEDVGEAGQATMSEETNIEIVEVGGAGIGLHQSIVKESNEEMSKLITGATLTMATGGNGSFAQAEVHANTSFAHVEADAQMIANAVAMQLFKPFLRWNGFTSAKTPRLIIHITRETDGTSRVKEVGALQEMGLDIDSEQMREEFHLRVPPNPDRVLRRIESTSPAPVQVRSEPEADA